MSHTCPKCHKEKPPKSAKDPRCGACYRRARRSEQRGVSKTVKALRTAEAAVLTHLEAIRRAEAELLAAVPEAAAAIRRAIAVDPSLGPSGNTVGLRASELLLSQFTVEGEKGRRTLLDPPQKAQIAQAGAPQVIIGLTLPVQTDRPSVTVVDALPPALPESE